MLALIAAAEKLAASEAAAAAAPSSLQIPPVVASGVLPAPSTPRGQDTEARRARCGAYAPARKR
jgi:hypothetical protein